MQDVNQTAEFFLSNYRLGKTLGIGSFGKVKVTVSLRCQSQMRCCRKSTPVAHAVSRCQLQPAGPGVTAVHQEASLAKSAIL
jgi:hypothetical protein